MPLLDSAKQHNAVELMRRYLAAAPDESGKTAGDYDAELDRNRQTIIQKELKPLLASYLAGNTPLATFKSRVDGINKKHRHWGFKGMKGQMFFNMLVNSATDLHECDQELKAALCAPADEAMVQSRMRRFSQYVERLGNERIKNGGSKHTKPKISSVPYFLSYFWQVQDNRKWPLYYTSGVDVMEDIDLWHEGDDLATNYIEFKHIHEELAKLFTEKGGRKFGLYEVEHVLWFHQEENEEPDEDEEEAQGNQPEDESRHKGSAADGEAKLPDSYVPPIIQVLPRMSMNSPDLVQAAKASGTTLERAFEKYVNAAFSILGYEAQLLGQGQGRVPDGRALAPDYRYVLLWDAKVRGDGYSMGTDDRTIREYITTQSRELKARRDLRNIYYAIVSSEFRDDHDDAIRMLKMDTDINEVILLEADALVAMVDLRLRRPQEIGLGPDGIQRLFTSSGVLAAKGVRDLLT